MPYAGMARSKARHAVSEERRYGGGRRHRRTYVGALAVARHKRRLATEGVDHESPPETLELSWPGASAETLSRLQLSHADVEYCPLGTQGRLPAVV